MTWTKTLLDGLAAGAAISAADAVHAECGEIPITEMNGASSRIITEVAKFLMEQGDGCPIEKVPAATTTAVVSLAENGAPDIVTELWLNSIGIAMSRSPTMRKMTIPVLDMLQTLPPFVCLIPLIFLFSMTEPKLCGIAIILHAIVPVIRLTDLGIRLVDKDVIEAAEPLAMTPRQKLFGVQIPLALPNIMAGVTHRIMRSLAMVVIASFVSAPGLGVLVLRGIRNLELGVGLISGLGIVLVAIILDRVIKAALDRINAAQKHEEPGMSDTVNISIRGLYKIVGANPQAALERIRQGADKEALLARSNHVLGLRDINVDMREGQIDCDVTLESMIAKSGGDTSPSYVVTCDGRPVGTLEMKSPVKALVPRFASESGARR